MPRPRSVRVNDHARHRAAAEAEIVGSFEVMGEADPAADESTYHDRLVAVFGDEDPLLELNV